MWFQKTEFGSVLFLPTPMLKRKQESRTAPAGMLNSSEQLWSGPVQSLRNPKRPGPVDLEVEGSENGLDTYLGGPPPVPAEPSEPAQNRRSVYYRNSLNSGTSFLPDRLRQELYEPAWLSQNGLDRTKVRRTSLKVVLKF